ncbi:hypothetical protein O3G_MSEX005169 [Manduca sexta]|uniref:TIR domain-containing protein n=1 Tax=Manduca sexta TaxID=7130 RepID=A0A921YZ66_MANSE|nr:hypothetical protein O3G_MSEX005169 [Manduca sexta]
MALDLIDNPITLYNLADLQFRRMHKLARVYLGHFKQQFTRTDYELASNNNTEVDPDTFTCLDPAKCATLADSCTCRILDDIQYKQVVIVHCSGLAEFPRLPPTTDKWILHLPHNKISYIAAADVSPNIVELDLRNNSIKNIDVQASAKLAFVPLQLGGNPIECTCEALKMLVPLLKPDSKLLDRKDVKCENDAQISLAMLKLCTKSSNGLVYLLFLLLLLAFVVTGLLARTAIRLRIKMILMRLGWMSRLLEPADDDRPYDAFVSFAHEDEELVMEQLAARLESGSRPYRLCLHYRDWAPGEWIPAQIAASVRASRRTVAVVSAHYLQSGWALAEIREATAASLQEGMPRLIIVLLDETDRVMLDIDPELRAYVRNNTYVRWHDPWFWEKLKQALPPPREQRSQIAPSLPALALSHDSLTLRTYSPRESDPAPAAKPAHTPHETDEPASGARHEVKFEHDIGNDFDVELSCNYIAMDNAMLPRFSTTFSVNVIVVKECTLPRSGSIDAAVGALNINILSGLTLDKFQEPAVITRAHLTGLQRLERLELHGNSNTSLAPGALAALSAASALKFLVLHAVRVPAADLARLPSSLQELALWDVGVASMHLDSSVNLTSLIIIDTHYPVVVNVSNAVALRDLHIYTPSTVLTEDALPSSLNSLELAGWNETHPVPKTRCAQLERLVIFGTNNDAYPLTLPDEWLSNCGQLTDLEMDSVPISGVLPARMLANAIRLKTITIRNCNLTALPSGLLDDTLNLISLNLSNNQLASLPRELFEHTKLLRSLILSNNKLTSEVVWTLSTVTSLFELGLSNNNRIGDLCSHDSVSAGPSPLSSLTELNYLYLSNTGVSHVCSDWREKLTYLTNLNLSDNPITLYNLADLQFRRMQKGASVYLGHFKQQFTRTDYELARNNNIEAVVTLSGSLECDCNSYWAAQVFRMKAWRASSSMIYCEKKPVIEVDPDTFTCLDPAKCATLADSCTCRIRDDIQYKQVVVVHCTGLAEFPRLPPTTDKWILHLPHNNISYLAAADVSPNIVVSISSRGQCLFPTSRITII